MSSWYSIILLESEQVIFTGYFCVDNNTNLVIEFYETINGLTNFSNNILIPVNQSFYGSPDNIYQNDWLQFNTNGCAINSMSYYNNPPGNYQYNLCSYGRDQLITNIGAIVNNTSYGWNEYVLFNITPVSDPSITTTIITVPSYTKTYGDVPFFLDPSSNNSQAPFTYSSNNDSVAEVDYYSGLVTLVSSGNGLPVTITVYQAETTDYTSGTANSSITVNPSTPENPVEIDTGSQLEYFLSTNASYAALENNITVQGNLINNSNSNVYKTIINPTDEVININIELL
jgi:hypothetical protein